MAFQAGQSGNPGGRPKDKPFREALRIELAAAGEDHKVLREIARNLIDVARHPDIAALPAIREIADRLDGKPAQAITNDDDAFQVALQTIARVVIDPPTGADS